MTEIHEITETIGAIVNLSIWSEIQLIKRNLTLKSNFISLQSQFRYYGRYKYQMNYSLSLEFSSDSFLSPIPISSSDDDQIQCPIDHSHLSLSSYRHYEFIWPTVHVHALSLPLSLSLSLSLSHIQNAFIMRLYLFSIWIKQEYNFF